MEAVGVSDPARCVYVGDRLFDDVWGAQQAGMRTVHIPLSTSRRARWDTAKGSPTRWSMRSSELPEVLAAL